MALPAPFLSDPSIPSWDVAGTAGLRATQPEQRAAHLRPCPHGEMREACSPRAARPCGRRALIGAQPSMTSRTIMSSSAVVLRPRAAAWVRVRFKG